MRRNAARSKSAPTGSDSNTKVSDVADLLRVRFRIDAGTWALRFGGLIWQPLKCSGKFYRFSPARIRERVSIILIYRRPSRLYRAIAPARVVGPPSSTG